MLASACTDSLPTHSVYSIIFSVYILFWIFLFDPSSNAPIFLHHVLPFENVSNTILAFRYFLYVKQLFIFCSVETHVTFNKLYLHKCTAWRFLTNWNMCITTTNVKIENISSALEFPPVPSKSFSLLRLQPWATTKLPWLLWVLTSQELYAKWIREHAVQFPVFHVILLIHPSTAYVGGLFPFDTLYGYSTVCCPFTNWWTFGMFLVGGHYE